MRIKTSLAFRQKLPLTKAVELQSSGRGFLVRRRVLRHVTQHVHVSEVFVIPKDNNPLGRCVFDFTNADGGGSGPNHPDLREQWRDACGRIILPGLADVCDVVVQAINTHGDKAVAGTADISGAFNHILDSPEGTLLHAVCVATEDDPDNDLILFTVVTMFGSTGGPYTWGVVSRALSWRAEARITTTVMYSDDKLCAGSVTTASSEMHAFAADVTRLCGPNSIALDKSSLGTKPVFIGWQIDMAARLVMPSQKAYLKMVDRFFNLFADLSRKVLVRDLHATGQVARRYSQAFPSMEAYAQTFFDCAGPAPMRARRSLTGAAKAAIYAWRELLALALHDPLRVAVPLDWPIWRAQSSDEHIRHAQCVLYADAQTSQHGMGMFWERHAFAYVPFPATIVAPICFDINQLEFCALMLAVFVWLRQRLWHTGTYNPHAARGQRLHVFTDNTSCAAWVKQNVARSTTNMLLMHILRDLQMTYGLFVSSSWIAGKVNIEADAVSRQWRCPDGPAIRHRIQTTCNDLSPPPALFNAIARGCAIFASMPSQKERAMSTVRAGVHGFLGVAGLN